MHISIWQQWASNHSGGFTLVGMFDTPEAAAKAKDELWRLLQTVRNERWNRSMQEPLWGTPKRWWKFNPIERQIAEHFNIERPRTITWVKDGEFFGDNTVTQFGSIVFIDAYSYAFQGPHPFDIIMAKLGAKVRREVIGCTDHEIVYMVFDIECETSTPNRAERLVQVFQDYFDYPFTEPLFSLVVADPSGILPANVVHNQITTQGTKLIFTNLRLVEVVTLPKFIEYLGSEVCKNVKYEFVEIRPEPRK